MQLPSVVSLPQRQVLTGGMKESCEYPHEYLSAKRFARAKRSLRAFSVRLDEI